MLEKDSDAGRRSVLLGRKTDRDAEECLHRHVERDAHSLHGAAQDHALAVQLDVPHTLVRHGVVRRKAHGQSEGVEPRSAARPG